MSLKFAARSTTKPLFPAKTATAVAIIHTHMFTRTQWRFPRAEYRPLTAYEEFFGFSGAKRNATVMVILGAGMFLTMWKIHIGMNLRERNPYQTETEKELIMEAHSDRVLAERERLALDAYRKEEARRQLIARGPR